MIESLLLTSLVDYAMLCLWFLGLKQVQNSELIQCSRQPWNKHESTDRIRVHAVMWKWLEPRSRAMHMWRLILFFILLNLFMYHLSWARFMQSHAATFPPPKVGGCHLWSSFKAVRIWQGPSDLIVVALCIAVKCNSFSSLTWLQA